MKPEMKPKKKKAVVGEGVEGVAGPKPEAAPDMVQAGRMLGGKGNIAFAEAVAAPAEKSRETWPKADTKALFKLLTYASTRKIAVMFACIDCQEAAVFKGQAGDGAWLLECGCVVRRVER